MEPDAPINLKSLRSQVYDFLRTELVQGRLGADGYLDLGATARTLGVSRTPLRDALLQMEAEGFVSIVPRKGVKVRTLAPEDIREIYQVVGALEGSALAVAAPRLAPEDFARLRALDARIRRCVEKRDPKGCSEANLAFHDLFLERCGNQRIIRLVRTLKQQLYEWNRKFETLEADWESRNLDEHEEMVTLLEQGRAAEAVAWLRDVHWSYEVQAAFVEKVYFQD
jgi:DNA-binding GntR family transcriptional regulator